MNKIMFTLSTLLLLSISLGCWSQDFNWAHMYSSGEVSGRNSSISLKSDKDGNIYTAGQFTDTLYFPGHNNAPVMISKGGTDVYITKHNPKGDLLWARQFGGKSADGGALGFQITVDDVGNAYVIGSFMDTVTYIVGSNNHTLISSGSSDIFLLKLNANGDFLWAKQAGGSSADYGIAICFDKSGHLYISGGYADAANFDLGGTNTVLNSLGNSNFTLNAFIAKFDTSGNFVWAKSVGGTEGAHGVSIATDKVGDVYISGTFRGSSSLGTAGDFDPGSGVQSLSTIGMWGASIFILKLNSNGDFVWVGAIGGDGDSYSQDMIVSPEGNVYTTGHYRTSGGGAEISDFDPGSGTYPLGPTGGVSTIFISKLNISGGFEWAKRISSGSWASGTGIRVDNQENVYTFGYIVDSTDFDPDTNVVHAVVPEAGNIFIHKMDISGNFVWVKTIETNEYYNYSGSSSLIDVDTAGGTIWCTSYFSDTTDFNPDSGVYNLINPLPWTPQTFLLKLGCTEIAESEALISGPDSVCLGESYTYSISVPGAYSYEWILPEGATANTTTESSIDVSFTDDVGISVIVYGACDSVYITKNLELTIPRVHINVNEMVLGTTINTYETWQWYLENEIIPGATNPTHTVTSNGLYKVVVSGGGCLDSNTYNVTNVGMGVNDQSWNNLVNIYPNPTSNDIHIKSPIALDAILTSIEGKILLKEENVQNISIAHLPSGVYLLILKDKAGLHVIREKIIKK